ncbi:haloacid dehalogenase type II [Roseovarius dicentrarchi]|uniref:haloacid dehalogenase type II n=1 Tax=Roseovarius dicentrarchi TaxID=2250573 RepID=UPI000DE83B68|nr:haloacid dehalogenase type II [Roseovarius dicentrarchi]
MAIKAIVFDAYGTLYDVQSLSQITNAEFPRHGELITQVWRLKQLEYTWLRTLMQSYQSFWDISRDSLEFTLNAIGQTASPAQIDRIMEKYLNLDPYPEAIDALTALKGVPLAILSNGNQTMLDALVQNSGLDKHLDAVISVEKARKFKPDPDAYGLVESALNVRPADVLFVSSNAFDATAAKDFGFQVAWIERVTPQDLAAEVEANPVTGPGTMFKILRMQMETFDIEPDHRLKTLSDLAALT